MNDVAELSNLTKLYIRAPAGSKHLEKLDEILKSRSITFNHLRSLTLTLTVNQSGGDIVLRFPFIYKLRLLGLITRLPAELSYYPSLVKMKLFGTHLEEDQIELLEKLPKLRVLYLDFRVFAGLPQTHWFALVEAFHVLNCFQSGSSKNYKNGPWKKVPCLVFPD